MEDLSRAYSDPYWMPWKKLRRKMQEKKQSRLHWIASWAFKVKLAKALKAIDGSPSVEWSGEVTGSLNGVAIYSSLLM